MSTYNATVVREDRWWVITIEGVGATQARHLDQVQVQAAGLVEAMTGEAGATIQARIELPAEAAAEMAEAKRLTEAAAQAQTDAAQRIRTAVRGLLAAGLPQVDVAEVLGVSRQRVTQLADKRAAKQHRPGLVGVATPAGPKKAKRTGGKAPKATAGKAPTHRAAAG